MKKILRTLLVPGLCMTLVHQAQSQLRTPALFSELSQDIKKIIRDYPNQFSHLQGDVVEEKTQSTDYDVNFNVSGAEKSVITRYSAKGKPVVSWEATMLTTDDFEKASKEYNKLFKQFNHMAVKMDNGVTFYLQGDYETPLEQVKFSSAFLTFQKPEPAVQKMKLEVALHYELMEWKVKLLIYDRDREDDERGEMTDAEND